jgi:hypothetical protein
MLRASTKLLKISPYCQFLKESKGMYSGMSFVRRARMLSSLYKGLDDSSKNALATRAINSHQKPRKQKCVAPPPKAKRTSTNPYMLFCKENFAKVDGSVDDRIRKLAKLWKENNKLK